MTPNSGISHPIYARLYDRLNRGAETSLFPPHREYLTADLRGSVLDVGIGTGSMVPYYADARARGDRFDLHAVEPDPHMRQQAMAAAETADVPVEFVNARAERLPFSRDSFDIVICSLVLCSVADLEMALSEVRRVLIDDGEFRFFEHVQSAGTRGTVEALVSPLWRPVVGGCHIDRRTHERIEQRFAILEMETLDIGTIETFPVNRFVRGRAGSSTPDPGP